MTDVEKGWLAKYENCENYTKRGVRIVRAEERHACPECGALSFCEGILGGRCRHRSNPVGKERARERRERVEELDGFLRWR